MCSSLQSLLAVLIGCSICGVAHLIYPTKSNSTHKYYITSQYNQSDTYFKSNTIECITGYCHIICDVVYGCFNSTVIARETEQLTIECNQNSSCKEIQILAYTTNNTQILCSESQSCFKAQIFTNITSNISLHCNHSASTTSNATNGACYQLLLNTHKSSSITINCLNNYDCYQSNFSIADGGYASLDFKANYTAFMSNIYANHMTNGLQVTCDAFSVCKGQFIDASNMNASLLVDCIDSAACNETNIYCPINGSCDINCAGSSTCNNGNIAVKNGDYNQLHLNCGSTQNGACDGVYIECLETEYSTLLYWNSGVKRFICGDSNCCPYTADSITCKSGSPCPIDCSTKKCTNYYIDASKADSLTLTCANDCTNTRIICPSGNATSCIINCKARDSGYYCKHATIVANGNTLDSFILNCGSNGCLYLSVILNINTITNIILNCDGSSSCYLVSMQINGMTNTFDLLCSGFYACRSLSFIANTNSLNISCTDDTRSCSGMKITIYGNQIHNNVTLLCITDQSCTNVEIAVPSIDNFLWKCMDDHSCYDAILTQTNHDGFIQNFSLLCFSNSACYTTEITANIGNSVNINCLSQIACMSLNANLSFISQHVTTNIQCKNPAGSVDETYGACYKSSFYIYGYLNDNYNNNSLSLQCYQYDCDEIKIYAMKIYTVTADCNAPYSCSSALFNGESSDYMKLNCSNHKSCDGAEIYCPYKVKDACYIYFDVASGSDSGTMTISTQRIYVYDFLNIDCESGEYSSTSCNQLYFSCLSGSIVVNSNLLNYDSTQHAYICEEESKCCYYNFTATAIPTSLLTSSTNTDDYEDVNNTKLSTLYRYLSVSVALFFIMIGIVGYVDSKWFRKNDMFEISCVVIFGIYAMDFMSDIFFAANVLNQRYWIIFVCSCVFLIIPMILNLMELFTAMMRWTNDLENGIFLKCYLDKYLKFVYLLWVISGSGFAAIKLLNSALFTLSIFDMGLKRHQMVEFQNKRLFSIILFENCPQMVLQSLFAYYSGDFTGIPLMSLIFSLFSIIGSVFEYCSKKSIAKQQSENYDIYSIKFDVVSHEIKDNRTTLRYRKSTVKEIFAEKLKIDISCIEQLRSGNIKDGLKLMYRVTINRKLLQDVNNKIASLISGDSISESIKTCWQLQDVPIITNLDINMVTALNGGTNSTEMHQYQLLDDQD